MKNPSNSSELNARSFTKTFTKIIFRTCWISDCVNGQLFRWKMIVEEEDWWWLGSNKSTSALNFSSRITLPIANSNLSSNANLTKYKTSSAFPESPPQPGGPFVLRSVTTTPSTKLLLFTNVLLVKNPTAVQQFAFYTDSAQPVVWKVVLVIPTNAVVQFWERRKRSNSKGKYLRFLLGPK